MNVRERQLRERDVRRFAPELDPGTFLRMYIESNFPQTAALPSYEQQAGLVPVISDNSSLKSIKKPPSGTTYDNPGGY